MTWQADARSLLYARLLTVPGLPDEDQIANENAGTTSNPDEVFQPTPGEIWIAQRMAFGVSRPLGGPARGAFIRNDGSWRLLLNFPRLGGTAWADALAESVLDTFPVGLTLGVTPTKVFVDGSRRFGGAPDLEDGYYTVPVDISWHVHTLNTL